MEDEILNDFLVESNENLSRLDQEFVQLEKIPVIARCSRVSFARSIPLKEPADSSVSRN